MDEIEPIEGITDEDMDVFGEQCPELAGRLHDRILDLQDEIERLREALKRIAERDPSSGPDYTPNIIAREALKKP